MSGASQVDFYNEALAALKLTQRIEHIGEKTPQAGWCNSFFDRARKKVLEQGYWSFASKAAAMTLILDQETISDVSQLIYPGWRFIYQRPIDCLKAQAVTSALGLRTYGSFLSYWWTPPSAMWSGPGFGPYRPPWKQVLDMTGQNTGGATGQALDILTDQQNAWLVYTTDNTTYKLWPESSVAAVALELATMVGGPLMASQAAIGEVLKMAPLALSRALAQNLNEERPDPYPQSPAIQARQ